MSTCRSLARAGLFKALDVPMLSRYCSVTVQCREPKAFLDREGMSASLQFNNPDSDGTPRIKRIMARPEVKVYVQLLAELRALERELGLSPTARISLPTRTEEDEDDERMREFLRLGRERDIMG